MREPLDGYAIEQLEPKGIRAAASDLADLLVDCVDGGASVSFMGDLDRERARRFWLEVADQAERDDRAVLVAIRKSDRKVVGTVQLIAAGIENQPHRAEIAKMLVLRSQRRSGLGSALMRAAEEAAVRAGKTLLTLDTANSEAERLYAALGWTRAGRIPNYALLPDGKPCATTIFFKMLDGERS